MDAESSRSLIRRLFVEYILGLCRRLKIELHESISIFETLQRQKVVQNFLDINRNARTPKPNCMYIRLAVRAID